MRVNDRRRLFDESGAFRLLQGILERPSLRIAEPIQRRLAAYHEAGHAVVARRRGLALGACTIVPDGPRGGHVRFRPSDHEDHARVRRDLAALSWGGVVAQSLMHGRVVWTGAHDDLGKVALLIKAYPEEGEGLFVTERRWVEDLLTDPENWHAVEVLSRRLLRSRSLDGRQTVMVIDRARRTAGRRLELSA